MVMFYLARGMCLFFNWPFRRPRPWNKGWTITLGSAEERKLLSGRKSGTRSVVKGFARRIAGERLVVPWRFGFFLFTNLRVFKCLFIFF